MKDELSHIDKNNNPTMVDVSDKNITQRTASAQSLIKLPDVIKAAITDNEIHSKKGPVFQTAIIAGVMAAKKTHELIPFCHPLPLESCKISITTTEDKNLLITCHCKVTAKTGVEMEALTGASVAALTIYDMCKALSHDITVSATQLITKSGGKSDINLT